MTMDENNFVPLLIGPDRLEQIQTDKNLVLVDLQNAEQYARAHVPGAVNLDYARIVAQEGLAGGLLPNAEVFSQVARELGICGDSYLVAYDAEGGVSACRLIWTLHVFGHRATSLLNGGLHNWISKNRPLESGQNLPTEGNFIASPANHNVIDGDELLARLGDENIAILDARSLEEYLGSKLFAARGGHIPGAKHLEWSDAIDPQQNMIFKPDDVLQQMLDQRGIKKQHEVVVHCQTHRRSSLSYVMLRHLGYDNVRAYHGSWSEWGNRTDTPIEC
jgi:thiosulfate/3-mercaptopyruvate sulfurtransferase